MKQAPEHFVTQREAIMMDSDLDYEVYSDERILNRMMILQCLKVGMKLSQIRDYLKQGKE